MMYAWFESMKSSGLKVNRIPGNCPGNGKVKTSPGMPYDVYNYHDKFIKSVEVFSAYVSRSIQNTMNYRNMIIANRWVLLPRLFDPGGASGISIEAKFNNMDSFFIYAMYQANTLRVNGECNINHVFLSFHNANNFIYDLDIDINF